MGKVLIEKEIQNLEEKIPYVVETSIKQAYFNALSSGNSVLAIDDKNNLIEVFPDGSEKLIKKVEPNVVIKKGTRFEIV